MITSWIQSETDGEEIDELLSAVVYYIYYEKKKNMESWNVKRNGIFCKLEWDWVINMTALYKYWIYAR